MSLTPQDIAAMLDHSALQPFLTEKDIAKACEVALRYETASLCARPGDIPQVARLLKGSPVRVCSVVGFPHGSHKAEIKLAEARSALEDGCAELDMVLAIGRLIAGEDAAVEAEIRGICDLAHSRGARVKVILETCFLTDEQKIRACGICARAGADWVKTSTGYGSGGCTLADLQLMKNAVPPSVQVKGSGGIRNLDTVLAARAVGATRCGVSATEAIMEEALRRYENGTLREADPACLMDMEGGY